MNMVSPPNQDGRIWLPDHEDPIKVEPSKKTLMLKMTRSNDKELVIPKTIH
jgi:hypothetical protein